MEAAGIEPAKDSPSTCERGLPPLVTRRGDRDLRLLAGLVLSVVLVLAAFALAVYWMARGTE
ncbi:hypothetical protein Gocc_2873 [Gaiella occulta]|uniref:Uncharacterized protein n=1 Tax=Gaiella occulta TaxID=1002870 RepID=A0A7M2YSY2_9ACTN|nr:hypothetical protein Gocc_2873 [Gaiella occulta]